MCSYRYSLLLDLLCTSVLLIISHAQSLLRGLLRQADDVPSSSAPPDPLPSNDSESCSNGTSEAQATSNSVFEPYQPDIEDASDIYSTEGPWVESPVTEEEEGEKSSGASAQLLQPNPSIFYKLVCKKYRGCRYYFN